VATDARQPGEGPPGVRAAPPIPQGAFWSPAQGRGGAPPDLTLLHRKAQAALHEELPSSEMPCLVIPGLASSAIVATDSRAFVFKAGAKAGLPFGARLKEFEYESVMRVDLRKSGDVHVVVIHAPLKISVCSSYWADSRDDPWKARNAIPVEPGALMEAAVAGLSRLLDEFHERTGARRTAGNDTPDVLESISQRGPATAGAKIVSVPPPAPERDSPLADESCPRCGVELSAGWQFCPRCGAPTATEQSEGAADRRRRRRS
jgi:zinc-ribbon domain